MLPYFPNHWTTALLIPVADTPQYQLSGTAGLSGDERRGVDSDDPCFSTSRHVLSDVLLDVAFTTDFGSYSTYVAQFEVAFNSDRRLAAQKNIVQSTYSHRLSHVLK
jgi:hypothetical protein